MTKICTKCKINKALEEYYKYGGHKEGRYSECKSCFNARQKEYQKSDKGKTAHAKYQKSDKGKTTNAEYFKTGKGRSVKAKGNAKYRKTDKGKVTAIRAAHSRRSKEKETLNDFTFPESKCILFLQGYKCANPNCESKHGRFFDLLEPTLDHIYPVSKGGPLVKDNVQYLCQSCNSEKSTKYIDYRTQIHKQYITTIK